MIVSMATIPVPLFIMKNTPTETMVFRGFAHNWEQLGAVYIIRRWVSTHHEDAVVFPFHKAFVDKSWLVMTCRLPFFFCGSMLVGGLDHFFHRLGIVIPTDELIFFRGVGIPLTRFRKRHGMISPPNRIVQHSLTWSPLTMEMLAVSPFGWTPGAKVDSVAELGEGGKPNDRSWPNNGTCWILLVPNWPEMVT